MITWAPITHQPPRSLRFQGFANNISIAYLTLYLLLLAPLAAPFGTPRFPLQQTSPAGSRGSNLFVPTNPTQLRNLLIPDVTKHSKAFKLSIRSRFSFPNSATPSTTKKVPTLALLRSCFHPIRKFQHMRDVQALACSCSDFQYPDFVDAPLRPLWSPFQLRRCVFGKARHSLSSTHADNSVNPFLLFHFAYDFLCPKERHVLQSKCLPYHFGEYVRLRNYASHASLWHL
jgi:hypothetical protein